MPFVVKESVEKQIQDRLKAANLKLTPARLSLLAILTNEHGPFTLEDLHKKSGRRKFDFATVYRSLTAFEREGLVRRCDFGDGQVRYEWVHVSSKHHHHVICRGCRSVQSFENCVVEELEKQLKKLGYSDISHSLEFFGVCSACEGRSTC
jgi:Fur family transcriptional regulator, ferric uptake regulator